MDVWPSYPDEGKDELSVRNTNKLYYYIRNSAVVKRKMQKENEIAYKIKSGRDTPAEDDTDAME